MGTPNIRHIYKATNGVTYEVFAYRQLSREEVLFLIRTHNSQRRRMPKKGTVVEIYTTVDEAVKL
jgi:hypothetical protein